MYPESTFDAQNEQNFSVSVDQFHGYGMMGYSKTYQSSHRSITKVNAKSRLREARERKCDMHSKIINQIFSSVGHRKTFRRRFGIRR